MVDTDSQPTVIEYEFGAGKVLATTQTLEIAAAYGWDYGQAVLNSEANIIIDYGGGGSTGWLDVAWGRAIPVTIDNTANAETLTDYQVKVVLPYLDGMRLDYGDIRFAEVGSAVLLPYWMEKSSPASATFWIKIPTIPASSTMIILAYYYNPYATSTSNGNAVFLFFDDFAGTTVDAAKWIGDTGQFSVSNGYLQGGNTNFRIQSTTTHSSPVVIETRTKTISVAFNGQQTLGFYVNGGNSIGLLAHSGPVYYVRNDGGWPAAWGWNLAPWCNAMIAIKSAGTGQIYLLNDLGSTYTYNFNNDVTNERIALGARYDNGMYNQAYNQQWDWIFSRKFTSGVPPTYSVGVDPIFAPAPGEGQVPIVPPVTYRLTEQAVQNSQLFDTLAGLTVLVAISFAAIPIIGRRMRRRD
jgi:hypothetical protein